jgi:copper transport protein
MAGLAIGALTMISAQGHASQAPVAPLSVLADALHLGAAAVWVGGLPCLAALLLRAPALLPDGGRLVASAALRRFSRVALAAVAVIALTGAVRLAGGLAHVSELWGTDYGRSLLTKLLLVAPIAALALRNRRLIRGLAAGAPRTAALRAARRNVQLELAVGAGIVVVAAVLVAQVPGRSAPAPSRGKPPVTARDPGAAARTRTL